VVNAVGTNITSVHPTKSYTTVNTAVNVGKKNFYIGEIDFTQDWNIVVT
jgi:hypothetical protein